MNRFLTGTLLALALVGSATAANAAPTTIGKTQLASTQINYTAECKAFGTQWTSVSKTHSSNPHFAAAKADAARGERNCNSTNTAMHKKGADEYEAAFKLLGVTPTL